MEINEKLNDNRIKRIKRGYSLFQRKGIFYVRYNDIIRTYP